MPIRTAVVPAADILQLRWTVLRPGLPRESAVFPEDDAPGAYHLAAYDPDGVVRGCASFSPEQLPGDGDGHAAPPAIRLRGMASDPAVRGQGYGTAVLDAGLAEAAARGAGVAWCNARTEAVGFYEAHGWEIRGEEFHIEGVGPHYVMVRKLGTVPARP
ncbi:GNAT family N-acetyltransferase [Streptomyces sp. A7024]|uniref:GNAT family N-acetyltransferase n=1 Tax=Streptomyces coryli TaxID=1128680 RepID=A0A6G4TZC6_9ACTN|nr:GNAT family N-acetyltransferase [Streptomyces coryli]NGN64806.1 GNAT family N-acetyltransferase [Streptomyces coryli]